MCYIITFNQAYKNINELNKCFICLQKNQTLSTCSFENNDDLIVAQMLL